MTGTIIKGVGGQYTVICDDGVTVVCPARGLFRHEKITPLVGDRVKIQKGSLCNEKDSGIVIEEIFDRKNFLIRPAIANLTHLFVVIPSAKPAPDLTTVDKLIAIAESKRIEPVIVVNKCDLDLKGASAISDIYSSVGFSCFMLSAETGEGCESLLEYLRDMSCDGITQSAFAGASAAGKSTLMSRLFPILKLKTGEVSRKTERGRHTTRHVELFSVFDNNKCFIADTPGFSLLDFTRFNFFGIDELPLTFREFVPSLGKCRYTKCTHTKEEGCDILRRVASGEICKSRHAGYVALYEEIKKVPEWKRKEIMK